MAELKTAKRDIKLFKDIFELVPYSILLCDTDGHHVMANPSWFKLLRIPRVLRKDEYSLFTDPAVKDSLKPVLEGKVVNMPVLHYNLRKAGGPELPDIFIEIASTVFPIYDLEGKLEYILIAFEDITERVHAENSLKEKIEELEKLNKYMMGRELKMVELKKEIERLNEELKK